MIRSFLIGWAVIGLVSSPVIIGYLLDGGAGMTAGFGVIIAVMLIGLFSVLAVEIGNLVRGRDEG